MKNTSKYAIFLHGKILKARKLIRQANKEFCTRDKQNLFMCRDSDLKLTQRKDMSACIRYIVEAALHDIYIDPKVAELGEDWEILIIQFVDLLNRKGQGGLYVSWSGQWFDAIKVTIDLTKF